MRILYLIDSLEGDGAERQFCELVKGVHATGIHEVHVGIHEQLESGHSWMVEEIGIEINKFLRRSRFDLRPITQIVRYIRSNDIQLVHAYMSMGSEFGLIASKLCGVPVITSSIRNGKNRDWREAVRTWYQSHFSDYAVANSKAGLDSRFKVVKDSFRVIHNGFDLGRFAIGEDESRATRASIGIEPGTRLVCMAARMEPQKDHRTLIDAVNLVLRERADTMLLLAGRGRLREELEAYVRRLGIEDFVVFLGQRRGIEKILSICDVSVLLTNTNIHLEGISNTIIESMALGVPVIATAGGGTDEILEEDSSDPPYKYGVKVDAFNARQVAGALLYLLDDDKRRKDIGLRAKQMVKARFNLARFVAENIGLYEEVRKVHNLNRDGKVKNAPR